MRKVIPLIVLTLVLSSFAVADDGGYPTGGRSCPPGTTCLVEPSTTVEPSFPTKGILVYKVLKFLGIVY